ncbi:MAG TPA: triphosphoribosyl-dephospho-CoA synthase [Burkholderiaceae bacterium]|nr:triphosphoribosyl-dephospho-CoA synthase [Burkholderiaceae bacterium]
MTAAVELVPRSAALAASAERALRAELAAYPKPGLVSHRDDGSHDDMSAVHFERSIEALRPHFTAIAEAGARDADLGALRELGVRAERAMLLATGGVNTHRGSIFALGLLLAAAAGPEDGASLGARVRARWGDELLRHPTDPGSHGGTARRRHGAGGALREAAAGFASVYGTGLPGLRAARRATGDPARAAVHAFFGLLAVVEDTNLLHRGDAAGLAWARAQARAFLDDGGAIADGWERRAVGVHRAFVERRLSPGGCADLLAATLMVDELERDAP